MDSEFFNKDSLYLWEFKNKSYAHFDAEYCENRVKKIISNLEKSGNLTHSFYPLIRFEVPKHKRDENNRIFKAEKPRYIVHTARIDANIYSFYRNVLMNNYENILKKYHIDKFVIAYRRIPVGDNSDRNKCNVHFANEAIDEIKKRTLSNGSCVAFALDISGFFDNLDHKLIKYQWCRIMGFEKGLPNDHYSIYKNITGYKYIDAPSLEKILDVSFEKLRNKGCKQICQPNEFREKVKKYLSSKNTIGIPQGTTISDVIANMSMIDFDVLMKKLCDKYDVYYRRYSDDILIICTKEIEFKIIRIVKLILRKTTKNLKISDHKTLISHFSISGKSLQCRSFNNDGKIEKPFEYLGLSFDGKIKRVRQSTISHFYTKLSKRIKIEVNIAYRKLSSKGNINPSALDVYDIVSFDMIRNSYMENRQDDKDFLGNFYTYIQIVTKVTGNKNELILFKKLGEWIKNRTKKYCVDLVARKAKSSVEFN